MDRIFEFYTPCNILYEINIASDQGSVRHRMGVGIHIMSGDLGIVLTDGPPNLYYKPFSTRIMKCKECKNWIPERGSALGLCFELLDPNKSMVEVKDPATRKALTEGPVQTNLVYTHADFGCNQWEKRRS